MIKYPEMCLLSGAWLVVSGITTVGYILICSSALFAVCRASLIFAEKKAKQESSAEGLKIISEVLTSALLSTGVLSAKSENKKSILH